MLKRFLTILYSIAFLVMSLNLQLDLHLCHDEITEISFIQSEEHCGGLMANECHSCRDIQITFENDQDQISQHFNFEMPLTFEPIRKLKVEKTISNEIIEKPQSFEICINSPPPKLYQLYHQYCFYG